MEEDKGEFIMSVMMDSWEKAIKIKKELQEKYEIKLTADHLKDTSITFFIQACQNIRESKRFKNY